MQRQPRTKLDAHRKFVGRLPCLICFDDTTTEAAHVRYGDPSIGKPQTGLGIKPDDWYVVPLCGDHHRLQHSMSERAFWSIHAAKLDPVKTALALYAVTGDYERAEQIVRSV